VYSNAEHIPQVKGIYMKEAKFPQLREAFHYTGNHSLHMYLPLGTDSPLSLSLSYLFKYSRYWNVSEIKGIYLEVSLIKYNTTFCRMVRVLENLVFFLFVM
jgi:hypothetical protein